MIARYRSFDPCPACGGTRLRAAAALRASSAGAPIGELDASSRWRSCSPGSMGSISRRRSSARAGRLLEELRARVATANAVGLDYMTLDRPMRTLSGGEAQRIQLATALGGTLTASLYVLDEPSIGLHARDVAAPASRRCARIRDQGNTVVVVEHAPEIIEAADHLIDLGPGGGRERRPPGGRGQRRRDPGPSRTR